MGVPLQWSLMEQLQPNDTRFKETEEEKALWKKLRELRPQDPLPEELPEFFFFRLGSYLRTCQYYNNVKPFVDLFPAENVMFIEFKEFAQNTEVVVKNVMEFVGVDKDRFQFKQLPPGMKTDYQGRRLHPTVERKLQEYFKSSNRKLYELLGVDLGWDKEDV
eukprot:TRINITY_DN41043_c0_g1_i1.p3 TRINITY_DN41043_c0_g1~~TRINITY_DN41043_c0_g1_i1.p3  ORF type:complete len:177 (-),score=27.59 TRINITY_DN41043_c0_g1_i1:126-611(-)